MSASRRTPGVQRDRTPTCSAALVLGEQFPMGLNALDLAVILAYLLGVTAFGLRFRKHRRTLKDYFLADRQIPWWAISLSIVAAETSTLTIISVPGLAYETDFRFLQLVLGYLVGRAVISVVLIPQYFRGELVTAYRLSSGASGKSCGHLRRDFFSSHVRLPKAFECSRWPSWWALPCRTYCLG